jgi:uncharacterized damage-inducible protein DinB
MSKLKKTNFKSPFAFGLARQFQAMWTMTRQAIEVIPDADWTQGIETDPEWFYSLRVYHIIETAEFYARDTHEGFQWGARLGEPNWWDKISHKTAAEKVVKGDMLVYLDDIEHYIESYLKGVSDEALLKTDGFHWFSSILEKLQYLLRHNTYHLGELTMQLRALGNERIKWE